jgi:predicted phage tail protein
MSKRQNIKHLRAAARLATDARPITGAKKDGGGSQRAPVEAADSLRSTQVAQVLDLLSEGEIGGLVNGEKSIYLDGVPLKGSDGTYNFKDVTVAWTYGTQGQAALPDLSGVENEVTVSTAVTAATPTVRTISNLAVDTVRLTIHVPQISSTDTSSGDINGSSFTWSVEVQSNGGGYVEVLQDTVTGKKMSAYRRSKKFQLPGTGPWNIRVKRLTPDSGSVNVVNAFLWDSYTEIQSLKLRYPNSALNLLRVNAQQFARIPTRAFDILGIRVRVPSNYNPLTRVYTGAWDGTWQVAWTDNPAWIFLELVSNERWGLGDWLGQAGFNPETAKWQLYTISQYCDVMVSDGYGGTEPRFTFNGYIQTREQAMKVVQDFAAVFRGAAFWAGGELHVMQDAPSDPVDVFTPANVVGGRFSYQTSSDKQRHSVFIVYWNNLAEFGRRTPEVWAPDHLVARYGVKEIEVEPIGITRRGQALRLAKWMAYTEEFEGRVVAFKVGGQGALALPGQVFQIADPSEAGERLGGRIRAATTSQVTLDAPVTLQAGEVYTLTVQLPDPDDSAALITQQRAVSNAPGSTQVITLAAPFTQAPRVQAVWILQSTAIAATTWRCLSCKESDDGTEYEITALAHDPAKFAAVEEGLVLERTPVTRLVTQCKPPTSVTLTPQTYQDGQTWRIKLSVSWVPSAAGLQHMVSWRMAQGSWTTLAATVDQAVDVAGLDAGTVQVEVRAVNSLGTVSVPATASTVVAGNVQAAASVTGLAYSVDVLGALITWDKSTDFDWTGIELRQGLTWSTATPLVRATATSYRFGWPANGSYFILARHSRRSGPDGPVAGLTVTLNDKQLLADALGGLIGSAQLQAGSVDASKLAAQAVDLTKLANGLRAVEIVATLPTTGNVEGRTVYLTTDDKLYRYSGTQWLASVAATDVTGQITTGQIADSALTVAKFAAGLRPVEIVTALPSAGNFEGRTVYLTTDDKLYRHDGSTWLSSVPAADITGALVATQIADGAVTAIKTTIAAINAATGGLNAGTVDAAQLVTNAVSALKIAAGAVTAVKTAIAAIDPSTGNLTANSVTATQIAAGAVTAAKIAADTITANEIAANAIGVNELAASAVTTGKIAAGAVVTSTLAAGAVTANEIAANTITGSKIAVNTISSTNIVAGTIGTNELAANSVTAGKIAAAAVTATQVAAGAITTDKLLVTGAGASLWPDANYKDPAAWTTAPWGSVPAQQVVSDGVSGNTTMRSPATAGAASARGTKRIPVVIGKRYRGSLYVRRSSDANGVLYFRLDGSTAESSGYGEIGYWIEGVAPPTSWARYSFEWVATVPFVSPMVLLNYNSSGSGWMEAQDVRIEEMTGADLIVNGAITTGKLAAGAVTANEIAANTITGSKIAANTISGTNMVAGSIGTNELAANSITAGKIQAGAVTVTQVAANAITTDKLLVTGRGRALNDDPACSDLSAWSIPQASVAVTTGAGAPVGTTVLRATNQTQIISRSFPVEAGNTYKVSLWARQVSGGGALYIRLYCYNAANALISYVVTGITPTSGALEGLTVPAAWTRYSGFIVPGGGCVFAQVFLHINWATTGVSDVTDLRCEEYVGADLIVDGSITASKINSNGLDIRDVNGSVVFASGSAGPNLSTSGGVVLGASANMRVIGATATKVSGANAWDSAVWSTDGYVGGAFVSASADSTGGSIMVGLNTDPTADNSYASLDYAWYAVGDGHCEMYESGSFVGNGGAYAAGDVFSITYDGSTVKYWHNGSLTRTVGVTIAGALYLDSSFATPGGKWNNLRFGPYGNPSAIQPSNPITGGNVSTYIAAAAIQTAQIANAAITNALVANLDAGKINTGTLDAARIGVGSLNANRITAGTITTDRIQVGAATAAAGQQNDIGSTSFGSPGSSLTLFDTSDLVFTSTGTGVTVSGFLDIEVTPANTAVQRVSFNAALRVDGSVQQSSFRLAPVFSTSGGVIGHARFNFDFRFTPSAGSHTYDLSTNFELRNSSNAAVNPNGGSWFYKSFLIAQENKV